MKNILLTFLFLTGTWIHSIQAQDTTLEISFHKIIVSSGILVQINRSNQYSVEIKSKEVEDKCLINTLDKGILTLKLVSGFQCRGKVVVVISCPGLKEMEIMGKAEVSTGNVFTGDSLLLSMKSGAKAYIDLDIDYLEARVSEGAMAWLEGYADYQEVNVSTSATYSGWELEGQKIQANATSNGIAKVHVLNDIKATAGSGGYISIKGDPKNKLLDNKSNGKIEFLTE